MIDCRLQAEDTAKAASYIAKLIGQIPVGQIENVLDNAFHDLPMGVDHKERLYRLILQQANEQTANILKTHQAGSSMVSRLRIHD